jgi:hypothetical protein
VGRRLAACWRGNGRRRRDDAEADESVAFGARRATWRRFVRLCGSERKLPFDDFDCLLSPLESVLVSEPVSRAHSLRTAKLTKKIFFTFFKKNWEFFLNKVLIEGAARRGFEVSDAKLTET